MNEFPIQFVVPINPIPKQSYRHGKGGGYQPKRIKEAQAVTSSKAKEAMEGLPPTTEDIMLVVAFYRKDSRRCDIDNLLKLLKDSMNKIVYNDDSQVVRVRADKFYSNPEEARTEVTIDLMV